MQISSRHYGGSNFSPSKFIEITVLAGGSKIVADATDLNGRVDEGFINDLEDLVNELKEQNRLIDEKTGAEQ